MEMKIKRILALCLALIMLTGGLFSLSACEYANALPGDIGGASNTNLLSGLKEALGNTDKIKSDGRTFSVGAVKSVKLASEIPEGETLPVVGNMETLLKLLLDRGALYNDAAKSNGGFWHEAIAEEGSILRGIAGGGSTAVTSPGDSIQAPSAPVSVPHSEIPLAPDSIQAPEIPLDTIDMDSGNNAAGTHSETNEQVKGVSEGDIVKTDGKFIYAMSPHSNVLRIIRAEGARLEVVSSIPLDNIWGAEFYLIGSDRLAIVGSEHVPYQTMQGGGAIATPEARISQDVFGWYRSSFTVLLIYDISDRAAPVEARKVSMDGQTISTRVIGETVYLVTNKHVWGIPFERADSSLILPYTSDKLGEKGVSYTPIALDRMFYIPGTDDSSYLLIGAIDVYGDEPFEPTAYLGAGSSLYMSQSAIYVTKTRWEQPTPIFGDIVGRMWPAGGEKTDILRFAINGTDVVYTGMGSVDGSPINQYSMDENNGYFRIATTDWSAGTYVTVLEKASMRTVGRTEPMAPGEQMHSMRFLGNMGYVVTFQNVDPLFTIDLTDPHNPKVLGELKIPGFSQYLHPVGDGLLLGIGRDTQEIYTRDSRGVETVVGFRDTGVKVSLFDVSDPFDPKEIDVLLLGEGWAEVSHNPRALMCDSARSLYGFTLESWGNRGYWSLDAKILSVENGKISIAATLDGIGDNYGAYGSRLCFIGNTLYLVHGAGVDAYDYSNFNKLASIWFN